jgi:hypothetical protein
MPSLAAVPGEESRCEYDRSYMRSEATATRSRSAVAAPAHQSSRSSAGWRYTGAALGTGSRDVGRSRAGLVGEGLVVVPSSLFLCMGGGRGYDGGGR